jgi:hypothetical protein
VLHGLVADFDSPLNQEDLEVALGDKRRCAYPPNWIERTLSGNARVIWLFEEPVLVAGFELCARLVEHAADTMHWASFLPALDGGALRDPARYFTNSCEWAQISEAKLSAKLVRGWLLEVCRKFNARACGSATIIPFDVLSAKLAKKYPKFLEWPEVFEEGAMGPSFWIPGSESPKSAVVKKEGIFSFAAHADKPFYSWADLLGKNEVQQYVAEDAGRSVDGIYWDGADYWYPANGSRWQKMAKADLLLQLRVNRQVSGKFDKSGVSPLDVALAHVQLQQSIAGAIPLVFRPTGLVRGVGSAGDETFLNISTRRVVPPAAGATSWGHDGGFPFISGLIDNILDPVEPQKAHFMAWLSYAYSCAHAGDPQPGQNIVLAGGVGIGKSLVARRIIAKLLGGFADASSYMMGEDSFGADLFSFFVWCIDDGSVGASASRKLKLEATMKAMAANNIFRFHAKFRMPLIVQWDGRVIITCNRDEESIRILPSQDASSADKMCLFRFVDRLPVSFAFPGTRREIEETIDKEIPFFARWLLDHEPDGAIERDTRYGFKSYREPSLIATAHHSSDSASFDEILAAWADDYFTEIEPGARYWEGTSFQLHQLLHTDQRNEAGMRSVSVKVLGQRLAGMAHRRVSGISNFERHGLRVWKLERPIYLAKPSASPKTVPATRKGSGKFSK